jgi:hypothetical protein
VNIERFFKESAEHDREILRDVMRKYQSVSGKIDELYSLAREVCDSTKDMISYFESRRLAILGIEDERQKDRFEEIDKLLQDSSVLRSFFNDFFERLYQIHFMASGGISAMSLKAIANCCTIQDFTAYCLGKLPDSEKPSQEAGLQIEFKPKEDQ